MSIDKGSLDQLLTRRDSQALLATRWLELKKALSGWMLSAELDAPANRPIARRSLRASA